MTIVKSFKWRVENILQNYKHSTRVNVLWHCKPLFTPAAAILEKKPSHIPGWFFVLLEKLQTDSTYGYFEDLMMTNEWNYYKIITFKRNYTYYPSA